MAVKIYTNKKNIDTNNTINTDNNHNINNINNMNKNNIIDAKNINNTSINDINNANNRNNDHVNREYYVYQLQGKRPYMEDRYVAFYINDWDIYGVFDGHGGSSISVWLKENIIKALWPILSPRTKIPHSIMMRLLKKAIFDIDEYLFNKSVLLANSFGFYEGSTLILLLYNRIQKHIYMVNVGDSSACIFNTEYVLCVSKEHYPNEDEEIVRIKNNGHYIEHVKGNYRIDGSLAISRAIGDFYLKINDEKKYMGVDATVSPEPDIKFINISDENQSIYAFVCSDGITEAFTKMNIVGEIIQHVKKNNFKESCTNIVNKAMTISTDNLTLLAIKFN